MKTYVLKKTGALADPQLDFAKELNEEQLAVVAKGDGPCLVLAGAGSGKTRTITYRVAYLLARGVAPEHILLLTFTNKAAREMMGRVSELTDVPSSRLWGGTFHGVCHRILRESAERAGLKNGFTILDSEDAKDLMKVCVRDAGVDPKAKRFPSPAVLLAMASYASNCRLPVAEVIEAKHPHFTELLPQIRDVIERYAGRKRQSNAVDFDDLPILTLNLLVNDEAARARYASQFRYVLVDEYQDTNRIQSDLVKVLSSVHGNVLVVGDDAQSIYSFRGADIRNILEFPKLFPDTKVFRLETNYRSTPEILDLANEVIARNEAQFPKALKPVRPCFAKPSLVSAVSASQEAEFAAQRILELRDEGVPLKEIAVLFRASHHSQALEFELMKRGIPYDYRGGLKFFDRAHVKDCLAYLKLMANKDDAVAWMRVLSLQVGVGSVTAEKIYQKVRAVASHDDIPSVGETLPPRAASGWKDFLKVFRELAREMPKPSGMIRALAASEYQLYLENEYPDYRDRLEDLESMAAFSEQYDDLGAFLADAVLRDDFSSGKKGLASADDEKIVLSTIHQSKGLEWEAVFVIHMSQGQFPNKRALLDEGGTEEERRLFYVAATRARRELYLCHPLTVGYDDFSHEAKSEFLEELPARVYEEMKLEESYADLPSIDVDDETPRLPGSGLLKDTWEY